MVGERRQQHPALKDGAGEMSEKPQNPVDFS